jgi:hypothetical protein
METKLFVTSAVDAAFFVREILYSLDSKPLTIVEVTVPHELGNRLFRFMADGKSIVAVDPLHRGRVSHCMGAPPSAARCAFPTDADTA